MAPLEAASQATPHPASRTSAYDAPPLAPPYRSLVYDILALQDRAGPHETYRPPADPDGQALYDHGQRLLDDMDTSEYAMWQWLCRLYDHVHARLTEGRQLGPRAADLFASVAHLVAFEPPLPAPSPPDPHRRRGAASRIATAAAHGH